jgi:hypothetical protein
MTANLIQQSRENRQLRFLHPTNLERILPLFIYLPGMDGTGELFHRQVPQLSQSFDIRCLSIPPEDRSDWEELTERTLSLIHRERIQHPRQTLIFMWRVFWGLSRAASRPQIGSVARTVDLINPASSFKQRPWVQWERR